MPGIQIELAELAALVAASVAAAYDLRTRRIPNVLTGVTVLLGVGLHIGLNGVPGLAASLGGIALGLAMLLPFYVLRGVRAGDVKLLAALGALLGPHALIGVGLYGALVGGTISLIVLVWRGHFSLMLREVLVLQRLPSASGATAPYGVAIAAGVYVSVALSALGA